MILENKIFSNNNNNKEEKGSGWKLEQPERVAVTISGNCCNYSSLISTSICSSKCLTFKRSIEVFTLTSHSLSRTDSLVSRMVSTEGLAAALDTITSIFPYFCNHEREFYSRKGDFNQAK